MNSAKKRLVPAREFPAYRHIPGRTPHPNSHPEGHSYQLRSESVAEVRPENWQNSTEYLYGFDLFNNGYYWESHEAWEGVWIANGRTGTVAIFLKGLIKLAALGVKLREGTVSGVISHARGATLCFQEVRNSLDNKTEIFMGLSLDTLISISKPFILFEGINNREDLKNRKKSVPVDILFEFVLIPQF